MSSWVAVIWCASTLTGGLASAAGTDHGPWGSRSWVSSVCSWCSRSCRRCRSGTTVSGAPCRCETSPGGAAGADSVNPRAVTRGRAL